MPIFVTWLGNALAALLGGFLSQRAKKFTVIATAVALVAALYAALLAVVSSVLSSITAAAPPFLGLICSWVVPDNLESCIVARLTVEVAISIYKWKRDVTMQSAAA